MLFLLLTIEFNRTLGTPPNFPISTVTYCTISSLLLILGHLLLCYRFYNRLFDCFCYLTCYEILQGVDIYSFKCQTWGVLYINIHAYNGIICNIFI